MSWCVITSNRCWIMLIDFILICSYHISHLRTDTTCEKTPVCKINLKDPTSSSFSLTCTYGDSHHNEPFETCRKLHGLIIFRSMTAKTSPDAKKLQPSPVFISSNFNIIPNDLLSTMFKQKKGPLSQAQSDASLRLDGIDSGSFLRKSALPFTSRGQDTMAAAKRRSGVLRGRLLLLPPKPQLPPQEVERPAFFHVPNSEVRKRPALYWIGECC